MKLKELNITVVGNFSDIATKDEYRVIKQTYNNEGLLETTCKRRKAKNKRFTENVTLVGASLLIEDSKSIYKNNRFLGNVKEVEGGFIPSGSVVNYLSDKTYKTFYDAKRALINKEYKNIEKRCFGHLAQKKFYYTKNYLKGLSINQIASLIEQFTDNTRLSIKIVKKFLRADIIDYYGQGGYKTKTAIIY